MCYKNWISPANKLIETAGGKNWDSHIKLINFPDGSYNSTELASEFLGLSGNNIAIGEDLEGNLQFYSSIPESHNGHKNICLVYDCTGKLMKNSHKIKSDAKAKPIVLKAQGNDNNYYLFTIGTDQRPYYHIVDMSKEGYGSGEVVEKNTAMDVTSQYKYGYHMALIEDNITKTGLLYMTRYVPAPSPDVPGNTEIVVFEFKEGTTGSPVPEVVTQIPGYDMKGEGELQISPDGKEVAYYNRKKSIAGFAHQEAEIHLLTLGEDRKTVVSVTTVPGQEGGTYGKSSVDIANNKDYLYFNQWGVYEYEGTNSEKNVFRHSLKAASDKLVLGVQYGEVRRGYDGKMYLAPQEQNYNLFTLSEGEDGGILVGTQPVASPASGYGLSGNLPVQSFRYARKSSGYFTRSVGDKQYELKDHLGNVRAVVSDLRGSTIVGSALNSFAIVDSYSDYYPFGAIMNGRSYESGSYRYGYQGQETIDEINGSGNYIDFKYRGYDPRTGRFGSIDPLTAKYPHNSPYAFSENRVIDGVELEGLEYKKTTDSNGKVSFSWDQENAYDEHGKLKEGYYMKAILFEDKGNATVDNKVKDPKGGGRMRYSSKNIGTATATVYSIDEWNCSVQETYDASTVPSSPEGKLLKDGAYEAVFWMHRGAYPALQIRPIGKTGLRDAYKLYSTRGELISGENIHKAGVSNYTGTGWSYYKASFRIGGDKISFDSESFNSTKYFSVSEACLLIDVNRYDKFMSHFPKGSGVIGIGINRPTGAYEILNKPRLSRPMNDSRESFDTYWKGWQNLLQKTLDAESK